MLWWQLFILYNVAKQQAARQLQYLIIITRATSFYATGMYGLILNLASTALVAILSELLTVSINSIRKFILSTQPPRFDLMRDVMKWIIPKQEHDVGIVSYRSFGKC